MEVEKLPIQGALVLMPKRFGDARGYFMETWSAKNYAEAGITTNFVQDNESFSQYGVLRGLHFQKPPYTQAKLVRAIRGRVMDVLLDIRTDSPTFGKHCTVIIDENNAKQVWVPRGLAHGFVVLSESAIFAYKCDQLYAPQSEGGIAFDDPAIGIDWQIPADKFILSAKDKLHPLLKDAQLYTTEEFNQCE